MLGFVTLVSFVLSTVSSTVRAGPLEQFGQVLIHPAQPQRIAVRYENNGGGLIWSDDGGETFALSCGGAIGSDVRTSSAVMAGDGRLWLASFDGLIADDRSACGWTFDPGLQGRWVVDVAAHPSDPDVVFAATGVASGDNAIYRSERGGPFEPIGVPDALRVTRLRVVQHAGGLRFVQSGVRGASRIEDGREVPNYVVRYSDDDGESWTEHALPAIDLAGGMVRLDAVDPTDPDRFLVSVARAGAGTTLYVSRNAGAAFEPYLQLAALGGIAFAPDGRVYIGDAGDVSGARKTRGLYRAANLTAPPELVSDAFAVQCLGYRATDATLFACDRYAFGIADQRTGQLRPLVKFTEIERFVECSDQDVRATCERPMLQGYCGLTHFPCAPICDAYAVDLSELESFARTDPTLEACLERRDPTWQPAAAGSPAEGFDAGMPREPMGEPEPPPAVRPELRASYGCECAVGPSRDAGLGSALLVALFVFAVRTRRVRKRLVS